MSKGKESGNHAIGVEMKRKRTRNKILDSDDVTDIISHFYNKCI